jgi:hypothetical protein
MIQQSAEINVKKIGDNADISDFLYQTQTHSSHNTAAEP